MSQATETECDVVIAGGGYAGLTLAAAISRCLDGQLSLTVVDRAPLGAGTPLARDARASAIAAGPRHMLEALGIWSEIAPDAQPIHRIDITDPPAHSPLRQSLLTYDNTIGAEAGNGGEREPASHIVENEVLRRALMGAVGDDPAIALRGGCPVADVAAADDGADVGLADGTRLRARLVVAADGRRSPLRKRAGIKTVGWQYDQKGIVTTVAHDRPHNGCAVQHFLPSGPFAILPLPANRSSLVWTEGTRDAERIMALDDAPFLAELEQRFGRRLGALALAGPRGSWPLEMHLARRFVAPRLALVGDAAHGVHPIAGQGLNIGFRDVAALTELLAQAHRLGLDIGAMTILERYERWRRFDSTVSALAFDGINRLFSSDNAILRGVRDFGLAMVDRMPELKRLVVAEAAGLTGDAPRLLKGVRV